MMSARLMAAVVLGIVGLLMLAEAQLSRRHERVLRARGAIEPPDDVYRTMRVMYPACFVVIALEGVVRGPAATSWWLAGAVLLTVSKALKYWAITALGHRWTFRVLLLPGEPLVTSGPYRFLRHPNYVAVAGELIGMTLMMAAPVTGTLAVVGFGRLMVRRMRVEERSLGRGKGNSGRSGE